MPASEPLRRGGGGRPASARRPASLPPDLAGDKHPCDAMGELIPLPDWRFAAQDAIKGAIGRTRTDLREAPPRLPQPRAMRAAWLHGGAGLKGL